MSSESDSDGDVNVEDAVSAKIKGTDETNDLAVVAVQKSDIPEDTLSLNEEFGKKYPCRFRAEQVSYRREEPEELAVINYTSD